MRVTREQFQQNREKILQAAARLFRERGFEDVGVAEVMQAAGLTHGGFYGHFKSKDELIAEATGNGAGGFVERWRQTVEDKGPEAMKAIADVYLSQAHRGGPGAGCMIAALGPEIARQPPEARGGVTAGIKRLVEVLESAAPGETQAERRQKALAAYAAWIGAIVLARISEDGAFGDEVLEAVRAATP